ncbi:gliding motility protein RemB [Flavobacterium agricola]|uniref:Gliding motility protein RemB n=1 Tax=Flavobacterium agricola TaxID=2870839 RepID=A0ABY6LWW0_9FLAO|nr:gliding motility protein RemB [Flavobacterium agricola]UYW00761.1 gliding motility protein RemB [Flavobacterium agricola]
MNTKSLIVLLTTLLTSVLFAQQSYKQQVPLFPSCESTPTEACFYNTMQNFIFHNFKVPEKEVVSNYRGTIYALVQIDTLGKFNSTYIDAETNELREATQQVINALPTVKPYEVNGVKKTFRYSLRINIPLQSVSNHDTQANLLGQTSESSVSFANGNKGLNEVESIKTQKYNNEIFTSDLDIPFTHLYYNEFDPMVNQVGANFHTASKPFLYKDVAKYYDFEKRYNEIKLNKYSWLGRKIFNENLVAVKGNNYWFLIDFSVDLRLGKDVNSDQDYTYTNTRLFKVSGQLGKQVSFTTTVFESQARYADYVTQYAESIRPDGGNPAIIPGIGIAKRFKTDAFDVPSAHANITYTPSEFFDFQLGYGRNFIGDGYRSLIISDVASPYPYFKINTKFWKIKYTNTFMWLKDPSREATVDATYATKYMANHYLSWNVNNRLNLGLFETVIWQNTNNRGFDMNFINPIIFYRSVEFNSSSRTGNAALGLTGKYKFSNSINMYGQLFLDEFSLSDMTNGSNSWKNKYAYQIGAKYYNAFKVKNLMLQLEYNSVRPYTYSHSRVITNYAQNNQSMGHLWGANFREVIAIANYYKGRWFANAKLVYGVKGFDFGTDATAINYGSNINISYDYNRYRDNDVKIGQGNKTHLFNGELQAGYLVNPSLNLKLFGSVIYRDFSPLESTVSTPKGNTTWFQVGLRTDLFNWYTDY